MEHSGLVRGVSQVYSQLDQAYYLKSLHLYQIVTKNDPDFPELLEVPHNFDKSVSEANASILI